MDNRSDITVLPADDPKKLKLGWIIEERTECMVPSDSNECYEFEEADKYCGPGGIVIEKINEWSSSSILRLEFLYKQPWNNLALNYVMSLNPTSIRVIEHGKGMHLDCHYGRVTIYLEEDNRTIRKIEQESRVGIIGCENGYDLKLKFKQQLTGEKIEQFDCCKGFINNDAIVKIDIEKDDVED